MCLVLQSVIEIVKWDSGMMKRHTSELIFFMSSVMFFFFSVRRNFRWLQGSWDEMIGRRVISFFFFLHVVPSEAMDLRARTTTNRPRTLASCYMAPLCVCVFWLFGSSGDSTCHEYDGTTQNTCHDWWLFSLCVALMVFVLILRQFSAIGTFFRLFFLPSVAVRVHTKGKGLLIVISECKNRYRQCGPESGKNMI